MLVICARLVYLQFSQYDALANRARQQQQNAIETTPSVANFSIDRSGSSRAACKQFRCFSIPKVSTRRLWTATRSNSRKTLGLKHDELTKEFREAQTEKRRFIWIARRLDADLANKVVAMNLPGVHSQLEPKRYYPNGSLAAHVLGYVGLDGQGLGGLEQSYNQKISGEPGRLFLEKDANGKAVRELRNRSEARPDSSTDDRSVDPVSSRAGVTSCGPTFARKIRHSDRARSSQRRDPCARQRAYV